MHRRVMLQRVWRLVCRVRHGTPGEVPLLKPE